MVPKGRSGLTIAILVSAGLAFVALLGVLLGMGALMGH